MFSNMIAGLLPNQPLLSPIILPPYIIHNITDIFGVLDWNINATVTKWSRTAIPMF